ncbi:MAG: sodium-translocating pyrophosphatase, partial [Dehalococcoidia bacterium]|nr:sodium-translocating pyrophosphatase [Dehalococcoidia bacterium]
MDLVWLVPVAGALAVLFALWLARDVLSRDTGTPAMQDIAGMIFEGAMAFLRRQYGTIAVLALVVAALVGALVALVSEGVKAIVFEGNALEYGGQVIGPVEEGVLTGIAFLLGAAASALSGYIGMYISVRSNLRTAAAAQKSLRDAITVALRGGAVSGFLVVAMS